MKIHVPSIAEEGKTFILSPQESWLEEHLETSLKECWSSESQVSGEVHLFRTNSNVTLHGQLHLKIHPCCDRCARNFAMEMDVPLTRHLVPYFPNPEEKNEEGREIELEEEDLEFSCYHGEEFELDKLLSEEVVLSLPMHFYCRENCRGLCPQCGVNWNEESCHCEKPKEASPFAALKGLKI